MKQLQVILTIDLTNDQYSLLLNRSADIGSIVYKMLEDGDNSLSFDFPAVLIPRLATNE